MQKLKPLTWGQKAWQIVLGISLIIVAALFVQVLDFIGDRLIADAFLLVALIVGLALAGNAAFAPLKHKD